MPDAELLEVVRQAARADDEHALAGQRRERLAERPGAAGIEPRRQRDLERRHIGVGVQVKQRHPGAMVQAAPLVGLRRPASLLQALDGALRQPRMAACRVADPVQRRVEAAEVVDRRRLRGGAQGVARGPLGALYPGGDRG